MKLRLTKTGITRLALLLVASGVTASLVVGREPEAARVVVSYPTGKGPPAPATTSRVELAAFDLNALSRPVGIDIQDNLFFIPPPPAPPLARIAPAPQAEAPPQKPTAPPLPFKFLGRLIDKGTTTVFVSHNGRSLNLKEGDTAADLYRVERISANEVVFMYEPLTERQVLTIESVN